jgi:hypothetical protein
LSDTLTDLFVCEIAVVPIDFNEIEVFKLFPFWRFDLSRYSVDYVGISVCDINHNVDPAVIASGER